MKSRPFYVNQDGELAENAPKKVQTAYDSFLASTSGQQIARQFLMFKSAGDTAKAQKIIADVNAGLDIVSAEDLFSCGLQASIASTSPRRGR